ncbi:MAG: hypothetical protein OEQ74_01485, partial [Gammaproteobacteria bacterium]|nr:hypothetical protein [Gammaproteobacteria bacterium]
MRRLTAACLLVCASLIPFLVYASGGPMKAYKADFVNFATLEDIDPVSGDNSVPLEYAGCVFSPPNVVFGVNFTSGMDYFNASNLCGIEWDGGSGPDIYLYSMAMSGCATGTRLGASPVGFTNLESLAHCDSTGDFYSVDFDFTSHTGRLIEINPFSGIGTLAGPPMAFDVRITGMTCDDSGTLWAVTAGHGGRPTELYTINPATGVESLVGETMTASGTMEALTLDTSGTAARLMGGHTSLYEINMGTGAATLIGGSYDSIWSLTQIRKVIVADSDGDGVADATDNCTDVANADQRDTNGDNIGNLCDPDLDNDAGCDVDFADVAIMKSVFLTGDPDADFDGDGLVGFLDLAT